MAFTYFFRDLLTLEQIAAHFIPYTAGSSRIRIWDAGCAMGQEPYSLAMVLAEQIGHFSFRNVRITASDMDTCDLFAPIIAAGVYPAAELSRIPGDIKERYFEATEDPESMQLVEAIRSRVVFVKHDLLSLQKVGDDFGLVLCKNVLLHFQPEERVEVLKMFHSALAPGGFLATEQTQKLPPEVEPLFEQVTANAQLFRKVAA